MTIVSHGSAGTVPGRPKRAARRGLARRLLPVLAIGAVALAAVWAPSARADTSTGATVLADYAAPILDPVGSDGIAHYDNAATIQKLQAAHVNTYAYLIYYNAQYGTADEHTITSWQWNNLPAFAAAAGAVGIDVQVYLVPPSESTTQYGPYGWDYRAWATHIADVAVAHPNIRELIIDDFAQNTKESGAGHFFSPAYVADMMRQAKAIAPWLKFRPIMYYPDTVGLNAVLMAYRPYLDGIMYPYRANNAGGGGYNTTDPSKATQWGKVVGAMSKCHGAQHCVQLEWPKNTPSTVGQYAQVSQTITAPANGAAKTLSFWHADDYNGVTAGYHRLQALIDNTVVWDFDPVAGTQLWEKATVDVTAALAGKSSATLTLRVYEKKAVSNFHLTGWFDDVAGTGFTVADGGFENAAFAPWVARTNTGLFTVALVPTLDYIYMVYASKLGSESQPTTAGYVDSVLGAALDLVSQGTADGAIVYNLNLTGAPNGKGDPAAYATVQSLYSSLTP